MKTILHIYKTDWLHLFKVPIALFLIIGLMVLPSLYAWFNLKAGWDPYGNTSNVPIAVTNLDEGATIHNAEINKTIHVGDQLVQSLKKNHNLGWTFVSKKEADYGVRQGKYYASLLIPKDFSSKIATIIEESPKHPKIYYSVNQKVNAIAPKIATTGATTITQNINESIIKLSSQAMFTEFNTIGVELENELPTLRHIRNQIFTLNEQLPEIEAAGQKALTLEKLLPDIRRKGQKVVELEQHLPEIERAGQVLLKLDQRLPEIQAISGDINALQAQLPDIQKAAERIATIDAHFNQISTSLSHTLNTIQTIDEVLQNAEKALPEIQQLTTSGETANQQLQHFLQTNGQALQILSPMIEQNLLLLQGTNDTSSQVAQSVGESGPATSPATLATIQDRLSAGTEAIQHLTGLFSALEDVSPHSGLQSMSQQLQQVQTLYKQQIEMIQSLKSSLNQHAPLSQDELTQWQTSANEANNRLESFIEHFPAATAPAISGAMQVLMDRSSSIDNTLEQAQADLPKLQSILEDAKKTTENGQAELLRLQKELPTIQQKVHALATDIQNKIPLLIKGVNDAARFMQNDFPTVAQRIHQAANFVRHDLPGAKKDIRDVANLVQNQLPAFENTVHQVADLTRHELPELKQSIQNAANKIRAFETNHDLGEIIKLLRHNIEDESQFLAHPVILQEKDIFPIPNYGSGMSPFYTSLCLWVGALLLVSLLRLDIEDNERVYHSAHVYLGRLLTFLTIGCFQALIVTIGDMLLLGAYVKAPIWFVVFGLLISLTFMTMVYTFVSLFGNIGKAIGIIFLVLQLSSGGGTFPIQTSPPFFQAIHPFLPFTYAVSVMREAVGGIVWSIVWKDLSLLAVFFLATLLVGLTLKAPLQKRTQRLAEKAKKSQLIH
ncbi:phage infection protein [Pullulanibacillus camelliae]|uniref:Phage infection protein n=1 Tax=Pullulanibacillus camelliae TaxID=1707096 RepID=A0A8J2YHS9_9BACL|nr:YhgE/Pip domain-containing protein [Pullulanibacillus camelliae]GGE43563.1 phage infection protein [Pullulanibacillus camelliae]